MAVNYYARTLYGLKNGLYKRATQLEHQLLNLSLRLANQQESTTYEFVKQASGELKDLVHVYIENLNEKDKTWAEFSTLDTGMYVCGMHIIHSSKTV